jgi:hypothetical protein
MKAEKPFSRRMLVKSSFLGMLVAAVPNIVYSKNITPATPGYGAVDGSPHDRHPAIQLEIASEVVGVAHFNMDRLKELVNARPELAKANWDWGFGDWESAIGAASHVGRRDIVDYLVGKGASPTIFTYAMLGEYETVKAMLGSYPGSQKNFGPHGISLLQHAKTGLQTEGTNKIKAQQLVDYLLALGDADSPQYLSMEEADKSNTSATINTGPARMTGSPSN